MDRKTPLYEVQKNSGAWFISFGGWNFRFLYRYNNGASSGKNKGRPFDVSHMGEIQITGKDAVKD